MAISYGELCILAGVLLIIVFVFLKTARYFGIDIDTTRRFRKYQPAMLSSIAVSNPLSLELLGLYSSGGEGQPDHIKVRIHARTDCRVQCFWNVDLSGVQSLANNEYGKDGSSNTREQRCRSQDNLSDLLKRCSTECGRELVVYSALDNGEVMDFRPSSSEVLTTVNSRLTTLVVNIERLESARREAVLDEDIVCLCTAIGTKCSPTSSNIQPFIHQQFIQTAGMRVHPLKSLYSSGVPSSTSLDLNPVAVEEEERELCIICHTQPVTRALLPCRHACVCGVCFKRTGLCPVCRSRIASFLVTHDESSLPAPDQDEAEMVEATSNRLNNMSLGQLVRAIWNAH